MVEHLKVDNWSKRSAALGSLLLVAVPLALLGWQLQIEWTVNPQYNFGVGVPVLAGYLFWKRWSGCPRPLPPDRPSGGFIAMLCLLAAWLPIRIIHEANPDWRLTSWLLATAAVGLGCLAVWHAGGPSWLQHFLVPVATILIAVPWPIRLEQVVTQSLMRLVVQLTADFINGLGYAAIVRGNFLELAQGTIAVNEGCSGIRSLQTALMVAWVAGELHLLPIGRRAGLLVGSLVASVGVNLLRAGWLTWLCASQGTAAAAAWHDPAAYLMLGLLVAGVWFAGARLKPKPSVTPPRPNPAEASPQPGHTSEDPRLLPRPIRPAMAWSMIAWLILAELATEVWYRGHEVAARESPGWSVVCPPPESGFQSRELAPDTRAILRCDEGISGVWRRPDGSEWTLFFLKWHPGRMAAPLAHGHTPDVCLPANGFKNLGRLGSTLVQVGDLELPFNSYLFENRGQLYFVFFCVIDPQGALMPEQAATAAQSYLDGLHRSQRLRVVLNGIRHRGQQVLEIAMTGYATPLEAQAALRQGLPELIR